MTNTFLKNPDLFKNQYRIQSARLPFYDYSQNGYYFVTICTKNREHFFGKITEGKMNCSKIGELAKKYWEEIPEHFSFVKLGEFIIMPNHMHGVLIIDKDAVETLHATSLPKNREKKYKGASADFSEISPHKYSLSSIIRSYKSAVTKDSRNIESHFAWQSRFHEHIIEKENEFEKISEYIQYNPQRWEDDCYFEI